MAGSDSDRFNSLDEIKLCTSGAKISIPLAVGTRRYLSTLPEGAKNRPYSVSDLRWFNRANWLVGVPMFAIAITFALSYK